MNTGAVAGGVSNVGATWLSSSALDTAKLGGEISETDFSWQPLHGQYLDWSCDTHRLHTGIPPAPSNPADQGEEALFTANGIPYATFGAVNTHTQAVVCHPEFCRINPTTGVATPLAPARIHLNAALDVNGAIYAFQRQPATFTTDVLSLNLAKGEN